MEVIVITIIKATKISPPIEPIGNKRRTNCLTELVETIIHISDEDEEGVF
jgi:hypothetical protein